MKILKTEYEIARMKRTLITELNSTPDLDLFGQKTDYVKTGIVDMIGDLELIERGIHEYDSDSEVWMWLTTNGETFLGERYEL